jgi:hypothetical protein
LNNDAVCRHLPLFLLAGADMAGTAAVLIAVAAALAVMTSNSLLLLFLLLSAAKHCW